MAEKIYGGWTDAKGETHLVSYKARWGEHCFTALENEILLSGDEITFEHKGEEVTGHLQNYRYNNEEYFGFFPSFDREQYDYSPCHTHFRTESLFDMDLFVENNVMAEYMRLKYYDRLLKQNRIQSIRRIDDIQEQKNGTDVSIEQNNTSLSVDEKSQTSYIYNGHPLPSFALEIMNGGSRADGWFINDTLNTTHYMFIWPHAQGGVLDPNKISYAYYALVKKETLRNKVMEDFGKSKEQLREYAIRMIDEDLGTAKYRDERVIKREYREDGFNNNGYLTYSLNLRERPVNLVVKRKWLNSLAEDYGTIG